MKTARTGRAMTVTYIGQRGGGGGCSEMQMRILTRRGCEEEEKMLKCECNLYMKVFTKKEKKEFQITDVSSPKDDGVKSICAWKEKKRAGLF